MIYMYKSPVVPATVFVVEPCLCLAIKKYIQGLKWKVLMQPRQSPLTAFRHYLIT